MSLIPMLFISRDTKAEANNLNNSKHFLFHEFQFNVFFSSFHPFFPKGKRYSNSHLDLFYLFIVPHFYIVTGIEQSIIENRRLQAGQQGNYGSIPRCVSSLAAPRSSLGPTQPPYTGYSRRCVRVSISIVVSRVRMNECVVDILSFIGLIYSNVFFLMSKYRVCILSGLYCWSLSVCLSLQLLWISEPAALRCRGNFVLVCIRRQFFFSVEMRVPLERRCISVQYIC
jgi:hypothetical protein